MEETAVTRRSMLPLRIAACVSVVALGWGCATPATTGSAAEISDEDRARIEREILALEERLDRAYVNNDLETYWSFYADDLSQLWDTGPVTLEQYKRDWTALVAAGGGVVSARSEDMRVRIGPTGDTAIATYLMTARYRGAKGNESEGRFYETDVWFRREGRWQIVHYHFSSAADALAGAPEDVGGD